MDELTRYKAGDFEGFVFTDPDDGELMTVDRYEDGWWKCSGETGTARWCDRNQLMVFLCLQLIERVLGGENNGSAS